MTTGSDGSALAGLDAENRRLRQLLLAAGLDPDDRAEPRPASKPHGRPDFAGVLLDSMSEGFYVIDSAGRTTVCNAAMMRLLGFTHRDEVIGLSLHHVIHHSHPDGSAYPEKACPIYRAAREGMSCVVADEVFFRRDGTSFPVEYRTEPLIRDGKLEGAVCTFVDITARVQADQRLKDSEQRLALALASGGIGIWDYRIGAGELTWDDRVRALFGLPAGAPITLDANLAALHPDDRERVAGEFAQALDPGGTGAYAVQFRAIGIADGQERWLEAQGQASFANGVAERILGVLWDISEKKRSELHLRLMVNELNHRVKNSLAMVQGVAAQTFRSAHDIDAARSAFTERLVALARAHDVLTAANWEGADLRHVVDLTVRTHSGAAGGTGQFDIDGSPVPLSPKAVLAFSLALHELATNALKYGALSTAAGRVMIKWRAEDSDAGPRLRFIWRERGGPPIPAQQRRGFGMKLIERGLAAELQGEIVIRFNEDGVICSIDAPLPVVARGSMS